jgi:hypothetical protein
MFSGVIWVLLAFRLTFTDSFKIEKRSNILLVMKRPILARFFVPSEVNFGTISEFKTYTRVIYSVCFDLFNLMTYGFNCVFAMTLDDDDVWRKQTFNSREMLRQNSPDFRCKKTLQTTLS